MNNKQLNCKHIYANSGADWIILIEGNIFMPLYIVLLGTLSSLYISNVLEGVDKVIINVVIISNCLFYLVVFFVVWKKQRKRDTESVLPQIEMLNRIKAGYNNM